MPDGLMTTTARAVNAAGVAPGFDDQTPRDQVKVRLRKLRLL